MIQIIKINTIKNMKEILKLLDPKEEMKSKEVYNLLKTNSKKLNSELSKKIKSFKKINDFFNRYSNQTYLFELLNKVEFNTSKNYDELFSSFDSNIEKYIFCFTQIIISIKVILKTQELLNKIFLSSKQYLSKLKTENKIENISQENLFFFIENLLDISATKITRSGSSSPSILRYDSCDAINNNSPYHQKSFDNQILKSFSNNEIGKNLKILNEEPRTPTFASNSDKKFENQEKENCQNIFLRKNSSLTLSGEQEVNSFDYLTIAEDKENNSIGKNDEYNMNEKKYVNLLEMINNIYRKSIINSEEKIRLKQLVIAKSKKLESLYYNIYKNSFIDENVLRKELTKLIN